MLLRRNDRCARRAVLVAVAILCGASESSLGAQQAVCGNIPPRLQVFDEAWFAFPEAIAPVAGGYFITGTAPIMVRVSADSQLLALDTIMDGFVARGGVAPLAVRPAIKDRHALYVRLEPVSRDTLVAVFQSSRERVRETSATDSVEVYSALYAAGGWHDVRRIATLAPGVRLQRGHSSDLVRVGDRLAMAMVSPLPGSGQTGIGMLNLSRDSSWVEYHDFELLGADYADLVMHRGELWLTFTATILEERYKAGGFKWEASIWTTRWTGSGWSPLNQVVDGQTRALFRPHLIPRADAMVLAWIEQTPAGPSLRWKGVSAGADTATQELPGVFLSQRGYPPLSHAIAVTSMTDASVVVPRPGGMDLIARIPVRNGIPALVGGTLDDPILLAIESVERYRVNGDLVAYSLKCGLPALLGNPPR